MDERPPYRLPRNVVPEHYSLVFQPDLANATFDGEAAIDVRVGGPAAEVVLNAAELEIGEAYFARDGQERRPATVVVRHGRGAGCAAPAGPLEAGLWKLHLRFSGKLNDLLRGFYRSKFKRESGEEQWLAVTQFEATDARRAFPCWDEPDLKASFGITVVADENLTVLSNAGEISSELFGERQTPGALRGHDENVDLPGCRRDRAVRTDHPEASGRCATTHRLGPRPRRADGRWRGTQPHIRFLSYAITSRSRTPPTSSTTSACPISPPGRWKTWAS